MPRKIHKKKFSVDKLDIFPFTKKYRWRTVLIVILLCVGTFLAVRQIQIVQERADYREAEVVLDNLYSQIEEKIGKPDKVEHIKTCGYSSAKFSKGILSCSVSISFTQPSASIADANLTADKIIDRINGNKKLTVGNSSYGESVNFGDKYRFGANKPSRGFLIINNSLRCSVSFQKQNPVDQLSVYLLCVGEAKAEHFPLRMR